MGFDPVEGFDIRERQPCGIVTDRELGLMNAIAYIFSIVRYILCRWHINTLVLTKCRQMFSTNNKWDNLSSTWTNLVNSETEDEYKGCLHELEVKYSTYPNVIRYLKATWLNTYKDKYIGTWVDMFLHFVNTTTNRYMILS